MWSYSIFNIHNQFPELGDRILHFPNSVSMLYVDDDGRNDNNDSGSNGGDDGSNNNTTTNDDDGDDAMLAFYGAIVDY